MCKAEDSINAMKEYFFKLPKDPGYRENEMGVYQYMELIQKYVSEVSLGQRCSALMKALNHKINHESRDHGEATDWVTHHKVYPRKILDTAFWFITKGKFEMEAGKVFTRKNKAPAKSEMYVKKCEACGADFGTRHSWAKICLNCYYADDKIHLM